MANFRITNNRHNGKNTMNLHTASPSTCALLHAVGLTRLAEGGYTDERGPRLHTELDEDRRDLIEVEVVGITDRCDEFYGIGREFIGYVWDGDNHNQQVKAHMRWEWMGQDEREALGLEGRGSKYTVNFRAQNDSGLPYDLRRFEVTLHSGSTQCQPRRHVVKALAQWLNSLTEEHVQQVQAERQAQAERAAVHAAKLARVNELVDALVPLATRDDVEEVARRIRTQAPLLSSGRLNELLKNLEAQLAEKLAN